MQKLGEMMIEQGILTDQEVSGALNYQKIHRVRMGEALIALELITEDDLLSVLSTQLGLPVAREKEIRKLRVDSEIISQIPLSTLKTGRFIPANIDRGGNLVVICSDQNDGEIQELCEKTYETELRFTLAKGSDILSKLADYEHELERIESRKRISSIINTAVHVYNLNEETDIPTVKEVNYIIRQAHRMRASDIHLQQEETIATLKYRIDGVLQTIDTYPVHLSNPLINRIKNMSSAPSISRQNPQDGGFQVISDSKDLDLRMSTMPTIYGEKLGLRISDRRIVDGKTMDDLGFSEHNKKRYLSLINNPHGILLVTGPTGSGKSFTINVTVNSINDGTRVIHIIADPVEHKLSGVAATQINEKAGITYETALRQLLRQDVDIIIVGEIRDSIVAKMSIGAAMTGHLILSTLHTNDSIEALSRLMDLGIEKYKICSTLLGATAQVMVRKICPDCNNKGCKVCNHTGFFDRVPLQEVMIFSDNMKDALVQGANIRVLREIAEREEFVPMIEDGYTKVKAGITTIEEVHKVVRRKGV